MFSRLRPPPPPTRMAPPSGRETQVDRAQRRRSKKLQEFTVCRHYTTSQFKVWGGVSPPASSVAHANALLHRRFDFACPGAGAQRSYRHFSYDMRTRWAFAACFTRRRRQALPFAPGGKSCGRSTTARQLAVGIAAPRASRAGHGVLLADEAHSAAAYGCLLAPIIFWVVAECKSAASTPSSPPVAPGLLHRPRHGARHDGDDALVAEDDVAAGDVAGGEGIGGKQPARLCAGRGRAAALRPFR